MTVRTFFFVTMTAALTACGFDVGHYENVETLKDSASEAYVLLLTRETALDFDYLVVASDAPFDGRGPADSSVIYVIGNTQGEDVRIAAEDGCYSVSVPVGDAQRIRENWKHPRFGKEVCFHLKAGPAAKS